MNKNIYLLLAIISLSLTSCKDEYKDLKDGLYAEIETSKGNILLELEYQKAPTMVANFVTLAEGKNQFVSKEFKGKPFYDGLKFHRVISKSNGDNEDFMIQTGDPLGNGSGDAGYKCRDEFTDLRHDRAGVLSMANSGPNTNSSQFFITLKDTPWLDGKHTVFGCVVGDGLAVAENIVQDDYIKTVKIIRKGEAVKKFDAVKIFNDYFKAEAENQKKQAAIDAENKKIYDAKYKIVIEQKVSYFNELKKSATKTSSGFKFKITQKSNGDKPKEGETVAIEYSGFLEDGTLFDTSSPNVAKEFGKFDEQRAMQNGYSALPYVIGSNRMIPGFIEGLSKLKRGEKAVFFIPFNLGYGEQGAGNVIPPNANLIFEVELKK
ncbi:peptidylprolyl isomerase [Flavobacterium sp. AS60]|uniref:peptidylprolyl isomerase n=1 Tax=Flavobacterium anseongense TaxID=2910677 RepID=UPI001F26AD50|nr:peptidylprolyl isomerase [Flavobacterium sp. AS60]MCF6130048.1 peptidylprolyl isomerase [Flavobacterium sp. AS60]